MGDPSPGFTAMVSAEPKFGKSTLSVDFAGYLARNHGPVLYVAKEEGLNRTLQDKLEAMKHPNLTVSSFLPDDLRAYEYIFLDSVTRLNLGPKDLLRLQSENRGKSFIYIFQVTKDGKFRGQMIFSMTLMWLLIFHSGEGPYRWAVTIRVGKWIFLKKERRLNRKRSIFLRGFIAKMVKQAKR